MVRLARNKSQTHQVNSRPQMWSSGLTLATTLTLNFQGQIWRSQPKIVQLPRNKMQAYQLNSRPQMQPSDLTSAMTFTLNFQGQTWNLLYLNQKWSDCHEMKSKHIDQTPGKASNVTNGFDRVRDLDIWIFKVKCDHDHLVTKVRCKDLPDSDRGDFRVCFTDKFSFALPWSKMPSTHLVCFTDKFSFALPWSKISYYVLKRFISVFI